MKRELTTAEWACLLVATDVAVVVVVGVLVATGIMSVSLAMPAFIAVVARGRTAAAVSLVRNAGVGAGVHGEKRRNDDEPPGGPYISGLAIAVLVAAAAIIGRRS